MQNEEIETGDNVTCTEIPVTSMEDMASGSVSERDMKEANVGLQIEQQRLNFRAAVFYFTLYITLFLYVVFACSLIFPSHVLPLLEETPYAICLLIFSGTIPTALLVILILSIFRPRNKEDKSSTTQKIDKEDLDMMSKLASISRAFK